MSTTHSLFVNWLCGEDDTLDFSRLGPGHRAFTEFAAHNALLVVGTIIPILAVCHLTCKCSCNNMLHAYTEGAARDFR